MVPKSQTNALPSPFHLLLLLLPLLPVHLSHPSFYLPSYHHQPPSISNDAQLLVRGLTHQTQSSTLPLEKSGPRPWKGQESRFQPRRRQDEELEVVGFRCGHVLDRDGRRRQSSEGRVGLVCRNERRRSGRRSRERGRVRLFFFDAQATLVPYLWRTSTSSHRAGSQLFVGGWTVETSVRQHLPRSVELELLLLERSTPPPVEDDHLVRVPRSSLGRYSLPSQNPPLRLHAPQLHASSTVVPLRLFVEQPSPRNVLILLPPPLVQEGRQSRQPQPQGRTFVVGLVQTSQSSKEELASQQLPRIVQQQRQGTSSSTNALERGEPFQRRSLVVSTHLSFERSQIRTLHRSSFLSTSPPAIRFPHPPLGQPVLLLLPPSSQPSQLEIRPFPQPIRSSFLQGTRSHHERQTSRSSVRYQVGSRSQVQTSRLWDRSRARQRYARLARSRTSSSSFVQVLPPSSQHPFVPVLEPPEERRRARHAWMRGSGAPERVACRWRRRRRRRRSRDGRWTRRVVECVRVPRSGCGRGVGERGGESAGFGRSEGDA
ncbi:hypothetical protein BDY24DRAFT_397218 [Mrakia frigida]|uniref:uncharacterized protein n=1 Tax=Mrakia frigida TaxID=29902 RepID=UPI003FCBFDC8